LSFVRQVAVHVELGAEFFFSSRRRHTSFSRDWSSDVCSSDLYRARELAQGHEPRIESKNKPTVTALREIAQGLTGLEMLRKVPRSEERRVGKESGARWAREQRSVNEPDQARGVVQAGGSLDAA